MGRFSNNVVALGATALLLMGSATAFTVVAPGAAPATVAHALSAATGSRLPTAAATAERSASMLAVSAGAMVGLLAAGLRSSKVQERATARRASDKQYWEGEWICADCGYIYNERSFGQKFEDLQQGFKCPQCAAPRRRFARKLGDEIGTTLDGGDGPILIFSAVAFVVVLAFAFYALS